MSENVNIQVYSLNSPKYDCGTNMSALPQKKLCWNCEGSVDRDVDNCSYCGVYLHPTQEELFSPQWSSSQIHHETQDKSICDLQHDEKSPSVSNEPHYEFQSFSMNGLMTFLKKELFPLLFLMLGSILFLFGVVLFLFSQEGVLTLQWKEDQAGYFLLFAFPLLVFGWLFLQRLENSDPH